MTQTITEPQALSQETIDTGLIIETTVKLKDGAGFLLSQLSPDNKNQSYYSLSNNEFNNCNLDISAIGQNIGVVKDKAVSDFCFTITPNSNLTWKLENKDPDITFLSLDSVYFYDSVNAFTVFSSQPVQTALLQFEAFAVNYPFQTDILTPFIISYKIQITMKYENKFYYFEFDPMIQTRDNPPPKFQ